MKRELYMEPSMEVVYVAEDVVTTSFEVGDDGNEGGW